MLKSNEKDKDKIIIVTAKNQTINALDNSQTANFGKSLCKNVLLETLI
jgi:hypothetical protein